MGSIRLPEDAQHLAGMVSAGHVTEAYAVAALVGWAQRDPAKLRDAALTVRSDPDALPLAVTLLDHAAQVASAPPRPRRRHQPPDASWLGTS